MRSILQTCSANPAKLGNRFAMVYGLGYGRRTAEARLSSNFNTKKQGATGITTVAPYVAGQWGRGE